ncbi:MAG: hypothetical protein ACRD5F_17230, partial [Candidatus Acidiferrales bacterium]
MSGTARAELVSVRLRVAEASEGLWYSCHFTAEGARLQKFHLILLIHSHQPVGNFDHVLEEAYAKCYLPFAQVLERHPSIRLGLHYSGALLEWVEKRHPEFFDLLRELVIRGQVELI